ncbi:MAG: hypothetical protein H7A09_11140 [Oceanospirillaceae bacterium]|nr:hypothetical protein [Oceanospirillaceae bacterium]
MRKIGFDGGHTVYELGPVSDVVLFFDCINTFVVSQDGDDWSLITDSLYRRYLKQDELERASILMGKLQKNFLNLTASSVEWDEVFKGDRELTWLDPEQGTLGAIFSRYFDLFSKAISSAISFFVEFNIYQPVRIVISDMPGFFIDRNRPLKDYDELVLDDYPFWLR